MSYKWTQLIEFAQKLYIDDNFDEETKMRTVINRAYYGAFIYARNVAKYESLETKGVHSVVIRYFKDRRSSRSLMKVGRKLETLNELRCIADYRNIWTGETSLKNAAERSIKYARSIEGILKQER